ncbi:hypothetical protein Hanom_Chr10g00938491 [Helianthus anomalus]
MEVRLISLDQGQTMEVRLISLDQGQTMGVHLISLDRDQTAMDQMEVVGTLTRARTYLEETCPLQQTIHRTISEHIIDMKRKFYFIQVT